MKYRFTFSSEDGEQTKDFDNLPDAETYMNDFIKGVERWSQTTFFPYDSHTSYRLFKDRKCRVIKIDKIKSEPKFKPGQTIDLESCIKKDTLEAILNDAHDLARIEHTSISAVITSEIVFVDDNGNQYEYDGVCISEGMLKIAIKSNNPLGLKIKKRYVNSDGKLVTDLLPFNFETNEAIRKERELMPAENFLTRSEIDLYLNDGFTINTYQASYCKEGHEFSPIEESK